MATRYRVREHVLVYGRQANTWDLRRALFAPRADPAADNGLLKQFIVQTDAPEEAALVEALLDTTGSTVEELAERTRASPSSIQGAIRQMEQLDLIESYDDGDALAPGEAERYGRQLRLFSLFGSAPGIQRRLAAAKVVVVGLGGIGGWLVYNLASTGIGTIIGFDHDRVELSNLNRQILYCEGDIGRPKAVVAEERLRAYNSGTRIEFHPVAITKENVTECIPGDADVIVSTAFPVEYYLNPHCVRHGIPLLAQGGGAYSPSGVLIMIPGKTGCFDCVADPIPEFEDLIVRIRARHGPDYVPTTTFCPIVSLCANLMALEAVKIITGIGEPVHNLVINPFTWEVRRDVFQLHRRPDCTTCGTEG